MADIVDCPQPSGTATPTVLTYDEVWKHVEQYTMERAVFHEFQNKRLFILGSGKLVSYAHSQQALQVVGVEKDDDKYEKSMHYFQPDMRPNVQYLHLDITKSTMKFITADVCLIHYLFNHTHSHTDLYKIAISAYVNLKIGGMCVVLVRNSFSSGVYWQRSFTKYGIAFEILGSHERTTKLMVRKQRRNSKKTTKTLHYCFPISVYKDVMNKAGFSHVRPLPLAFKESDEIPSEFWDDLKANPHQMVLLGYKWN